MKINKILSRYSVIVIMMLLYCSNASATITTHSEQIVKKYPVTRESNVYITNKYGKVHVSNWNKDSVIIEISLMIRSSNSARVYKLKDNISFDFVKTKYNITASTLFGGPYNSIFSDLKNLAETFVSTENQVTIDYYIKAPEWINLNIDHKYGDVFIDDASGDLNITLSNGQLKANKLNGNTVLNLSSGDADIYFLKDGKIISNYLDLTVKNADKIDITSKSCNINLYDVKYCKINSRRDKYYITSVEKAYGDSYFSDIILTELNQEVSLDMKYGNITIDKISRKFSLINLGSEYTDISIIFERNMTYNFDMTHYNDISFVYPKEISKLQEKLVDQETNEYFVYGTIGTDTEPNAKVNIKAYKKCYIRIEHK